MKKFVSLFLALIITSNLAVETYALSPAYLNNVKIDGNKSIIMFEGDEITLRAVAEPVGVKYAYIAWATDNDNAIILTENDKTIKLNPPVSTVTIKAIKTGTVVLTVFADLSEYFLPELYPDGYESDSVTIHVIPDCSLGDANGDSAIDVKDVISVRQHLAKGYDATVFEPLADVNKDNTVDVRDIVLLRRYIAGGYGIELK